MHYEAYYVKPHDISQNILVLRDAEVHHLCRVKRNAIGDRIWAVDGRGGAYEIELTLITKTRAEGHILQTRRKLGEPVAEVTLAQALIQDERFEWLIEKCTELGIRRIIPMITKNSVAKAWPRKLIRWQKITLSAMKQCGRTMLPEIMNPQPYDRVLKLGTDCHYRIIAEAGSEGVSPISPVDGIRKTQKALLLVGPEGGFTHEEIQQAQRSGFEAVSLGPRRLRAETAGIVLSTKVLSFLGELE